MKKVLVLGLGISGKSVAEYCLKQGIEVFAVDKKPMQNGDYPIFSDDDEKAFKLLNECDCLIKSPGIAWDHPLVKAAKGKVEILSEMELGLRALKNTNKILLGVTGSNGKTTTTMLVTHVLKKLGKKVSSSGNIGIPILSKVDSDDEILVIELSSYQIETLKTKALDAAVIINITENHLERYDSFLDYAKAKLHLENIVKKKEKLFVHNDVAKNFQALLTSLTLFPSLNIEENIATFFSLRYRDGRLSHDFENCQAAFALCREIGVTESEFWQAASSFVKPPHRLEYVRHYKGIAYVNDSKATTVDAVIKGVDSILGNIVLIAGGLDKGGSYSAWKEALKNKVKKVLLIGKSQEKIYNEITPDLDAEKVGNLNEALKKASWLAQKGDTVLLSPGCASYDQFQNFEHRGEEFKKLVLSLEEI